MDSKTFITRLAKLTDSDQKATAAMVSAFGSILCEKAADLDTIAIPGFGNFVAMKRPEHVVFDKESQHRMLVPPEITIEFIAGTKLKKKVTLK